MRWLTFLLLLGTGAPGAADPRAALFGVWGTPGQCRGALIQPGGSVRASPFELSAGWLQHGGLWCRLTWFDPQVRADGLFAGAMANCGEDAARGYRLGVLLDRGRLTLIWDEALVNGPLDRCSAPGAINR